VLYYLPGQLDDRGGHHFDASERHQATRRLHIPSTVANMAAVSSCRNIRFITWKVSYTICFLKPEACSCQDNTRAGEVAK
jgi:hypothetical protein